MPNEIGHSTDLSMSSLSTRLFLNSWGFKNNLRYWLYWSRCKKRYAQQKHDKALDQYLAQVKQRGFSNLGQADINQLYTLAKSYFDTKTSDNGMIEMDNQHTAEISDHIYTALMSIHDKVCACYQSYFQVCTVRVQKIFPSHNDVSGSFGFHTDDTPYGLAKVFIYLNDTFEDNGTFRTFDYNITKRLIRKGFIRSSAPGKSRIDAQKLIEQPMLKHLNVLEGKQGTSLFFDNNLAHKGTFPNQGYRIHVVFEIMPSPKPLDKAHLCQAAKRQIIDANYFPINPLSIDTKAWPHLIQ